MLDDSLSAVDSSVAVHIFEHAIVGLLNEKTVILVTHGIKVLLISYWKDKSVPFPSSVKIYPIF